MKLKFLSFLFVLMLVIGFASPVLAQDETPPPETEPQLSELSPYAPTEGPVIDKQPLPDAIHSEDRLVMPMPRNRVEVETRWQDQYSAADHGGNYVAVAHNSDGDIHVFIYYYGVYIDRFQVSDGNGHSYNADIAYEAASGLFIVTWQVNNSAQSEGWNVQAVAVDPYNLGNHIVGDIVDIASSSWDETDPSIDCNYYDPSCLIAYNLDNGSDFYRIDGRYMDIDSTSGVVAGTSSPNFAISNLNNEHNPHVAWSEPNYNYMVAYTWPATGGGEQYPVHSVVMEYYYTETDTDFPVLQWTAYSIATEWLGHTNKFTNSIAYDICSENYVIAFTHDSYGDGSDDDVYVTVVDGDTYQLHGLTPIAVSSADEHSPDISYLKDADIAEGNPAPDKLVIAYVRNHYLDLNGVIATDIRGTCNPTTPTYEVDSPGTLHHVVENSGGSDLKLQQPSITGSNNWWEFFVAYTYLDGSDYNIYGRYMDSSTKNYLPLMIK
ncbi:hypothetical protein KQH50_03105 [bacterium]|nr:hypothetical protein [bacterium]